MSEWKPGDVALIRTQGGDHEVLGLRDTHGWAHLKDWRSPHGSHSIWTSASQVTAVRPLLVIDPEDREQVERLAALLHNFDAHLADDPHRESAWVSLATAALREFANPTPPRPDEPMAMAAVVEDKTGRHWVRVAPAMDGMHYPWHSGNDEYAYADINVVRILSEGVS